VTRAAIVIFDLAWIVERQSGRELADAIAPAVEYERRGPVHCGPRSHAGSTQRPVG
jgi:hypothetical protein